LQYLGTVAFREPVPAYKHSAAVFLHLTGRIPTDLTHPQNLKRPTWEREILQDCARRLGHWYSLLGDTPTPVSQKEAATCWKQRERVQKRAQTDDKEKHGICHRGTETQRRSGLEKNAGWVHPRGDRKYAQRGENEGDIDATTVLLSIFLVYLSYFSRIVYPSIPHAFGDEKPLSVCFIEGQKPLPNSLVTDGRSHRTIPYQLLDASERSYYVISLKAIEISRDSVDGVVVLK
jgi:hypothetical protein